MSNDPMLDERTHASLMRGIGYARQGQWQQALRALHNVLEDDPTHIEGHYQLAVCHAQLGSARESVRLLRYVLSFPALRDADRVRFTQLLGRVSIQANDYATAAECFEQAMDLLGTSEGPILNQLAQVMCKSGNYRRGFELFTRAMKSS